MPWGREEISAALRWRALGPSFAAAGRYVGAADAEEDSEPFPEKMQRLTAQLKSQFEESDRLEKAIKDNLAGIGYEL